MTVSGLASALESVRPWVTSGGVLGLLGIAVKLYLDNRRLRMAAEKRAQEYKLEVSADGRTNLQFIIDNLRRDTERADKRAAAAESAHLACEVELDRVRDDGRRTRDKLDGLVRQFVNFADSVAMGIPPGTWSPEISNMMQQLAALGRVSRETLLPPGDEPKTP